ncbi:MAG: hypothetical protein PSV22_06310 [Pseudolabrys sp.]|jgi:hypothetical protein|nr:hypothetical protein [Pseudolabrys sp.]
MLTSTVLTLVAKIAVTGWTKAAANVKKALANSEPSTHGTKETASAGEQCPLLADFVEKVGGRSKQIAP